jgi:hypothetical protein
VDAICGGAVPGDDDVFRLPSGYRPAGTAIFAAPSLKAYGEVRIEADGDVVVTNPSHYDWLSFDGIHLPRRQLKAALSDLVRKAMPR